MKLELLIQETIDTLTKTWSIAKKENIEPMEKIQISNFMNFCKIRVFSSNNSARAVFDEFEQKPMNQKLEGKLEVWLEVILSNNKDLHQEFEKKIENHQTLFQKFESNQKPIISQNIEIQESNNTPVIKEDPALNGKGETFIAYDFNEYSDYALEYAIKYSKLLNTTLTLVATAKQGKDKIILTSKIKTLLSEISKKHHIEPKAIVKEINIFAALKELEETHPVNFVFYGVKGSTDMDAISGSPAPVLVVHDFPKEPLIEKILLPMDSRKEIKKILGQVVYLSKYAPIKCFLSVPESFPNEVNHERTISNLKFFEGFLKSRNIAHETVTVQGTRDTTEAALKSIKEIKIQLVMILTELDVSFKGLTIGSWAHKLIENQEKIPVMCVSSSDKSIGNSYGGGILY